MEAKEEKRNCYLQICRTPGRNLMTYFDNMGRPQTKKIDLSKEDE